MVGARLFQRIPKRAGPPALAWIAYLAAFPLLHPLLDTHTGITAFVPVVVTAWYAGKVLGALTGVATVPVTAVLMAWLPGGMQWFSSAALLGAGAMVLVGALLGYMRELDARHEAEIEVRHGVEASLRERDARLTLVNEIARNVRRGESVDAIIRTVVDGMHCSFPAVRAAYSTLAPGGEITIVHTSGPNELSWPKNIATGLTLPASVIKSLRDRDLIVVADVEIDRSAGPPRAARVGGNARAFLDAPVPHSDELTGLLSFDSPTPREWSEHERATLRDVADVLAIAIMDVRRKRALEESEERFRTVFEQSPFGMVVIDPDFRIAKVNRALCTMLGYDEAELVGRAPREITHPDDRDAPSAAQPSIVAGQAVSLQKRYLKKNGETVVASATTSAVHDSGETLLYTIVMIENITDRLELEKQLRQAYRLESVGQLAGGVAHNFNNALTAIFGYSELLARRFDAEDPAMKDLEQIQRVAEQSAALTRQLLAFSRKEMVRPSVFSLNEVVESTRDLLSPLIGEQVRIRFRLDRTARHVRADRSQMEQVITNLVLNARDAMLDGGTITVETKGLPLDEAFARTHPEARAGRYVRLTVSDTGTGMDDATAARVFEPFFTTKEPGEGVGLGLAMVHGAVKQGGGFVTVDSELGVGATFALYLPVFEERVQPSAPDRASMSEEEPTP